MQIFISWSGERSKRVGLLLKDWIKCVLQVSKPWMSDVDIDRGSVWFSEIGKALDGCLNAIICLTKGNLLTPWLLFEAGALAKGLSSARVCTFLIDVQPNDIGEPLSQFNHTFPTKESMRKLVISLNNRLNESSLSIDIINMVFETYWPQFIERFQEIIKSTEEEALPSRSEKDVLSDVLYTMRRIDKRLSSVEGSIGVSDFHLNNKLLGYLDKEASNDNSDKILSYLASVYSTKKFSLDELANLAIAKFDLSEEKAKYYLELVRKHIIINPLAT